MNKNKKYIKLDCQPYSTYIICFLSETISATHKKPYKCRYIRCWIKNATPLNFQPPQWPESLQVTVPVLYHQRHRDSVERCQNKASCMNFSCPPLPFLSINPNFQKKYKTLVALKLILWCRGGPWPGLFLSGFFFKKKKTVATKFLQKSLGKSLFHIFFV